MKFKLNESYIEDIIEQDYPENRYSNDDIDNIRDLTYNSYSDSELWEAFKDIVWPTFSDKAKQEFLDDFEEGYTSILEVPVEDGMSDRLWITDALDEFDFFDEDYSYYAGEYFDGKEYADNLADYKQYDEIKKGIGLGVVR